MSGIAKAATAVSLAVHEAILKGGEPTRDIADALHGKWLGHPLHPVLTDITIGAWMIGGLFDVMGAWTGDKSCQRIGDRLAEVGTVSAVPTLLTGVTDYSTFPEKSATPATIHGATNIINILLYALSVRERRRGNRRRGLTLSFFAIGLSTFSAWIGGMLVYKEKVGVDHRDDFEGPNKWTAVLEASKLHNRKPTRVEFEGKPVLLYREGEKVSAIGATCTHAGGPLDEGKVSKGCVTCPWHDSVFNLQTGEVVHGPATFPQPRFAARLTDGQVEIRLVRA
jgi:nitrite reductase/ring-hydroxylating ferredoxin subunit/uncharacterized membrane protein